MYQHTLNSSHPCQSHPNYQTKAFKCKRKVNTFVPINKCHTHNFHRDFHPICRCCYQPNTCSSYHQIFPKANHTINHSFHPTACCRPSRTQQKFIDPSSYRVTVRRISPFDVDVSYPNDLVPTVPFKKIVAINDGTAVSSTSFMTASDDQKSFNRDLVVNESIEYLTRNTQKCRKLIFSKAELKKSNSNGSQNETIKHIHMTNKQSSNRSPSIIDITEEASSSKTSSDFVEQPNCIVSGNAFHAPTLPKSQPPNIDEIKSNEMLVYSSQSLKSVTSFINGRQQSTKKTSKTSLGLHHTRSTLDFGLLFEDTVTQKLDSFRHS